MQTNYRKNKEYRGDFTIPIAGDFTIKTRNCAGDFTRISSPAHRVYPQPPSGLHHLKTDLGILTTGGTELARRRPPSVTCTFAVG